MRPSASYKLCRPTHSPDDNEALLKKMGAVSLGEIEERHALDQKRAELQDELSMTYTVKVYRGECDVKCLGLRMS